jgi:hypothetical protein
MHQGLLRRTSFGSLDNTVYSTKHLDSSLKVNCAFSYKGVIYIAMQKIKGDMLANRWVKRSLESKARVVAQLRGMINEMRGIPCPKRGVSNVDGMKYECRISTAFREYPQIPQTAERGC